MKILLTTLCFILVFASSYSQTTPPFVQRTTGAITPIDNRLKAAWNLYMPVVADTSTALNGGIDSLGLIVYSRAQQGVFIRDTTPPSGKKWTKLLKTGDVVNPTLLSGRIGFGAANNTLYAGTDSLRYNAATRTLIINKGGSVSPAMYIDQSFTGTNPWLIVVPPILNDSTMEYGFYSVLNPNEDGTRSNHVVVDGFNYLNTKPWLPGWWRSRESYWQSGGAFYIEDIQEARLPNAEHVRTYMQTFIVRDSLGNSSNQIDFRGNSLVLSTLTNRGFFAVAGNNMDGVNFELNTPDATLGVRINKTSGVANDINFSKIGSDFGYLNFQGWAAIRFAPNGLNIDPINNILHGDQTSGPVTLGQSVLIRRTGSWPTSIGFADNSGGALASISVNAGTGEMTSSVPTGYYHAWSINTERMRLSQNGNLLINNTGDNSIGKLQVNGLITALSPDDADSSFRVPTTAWVKRNVVGGGGVSWGVITGSISNQTDLQDSIDALQADIALRPTGTGNTGIIPVWNGSNVLSTSTIIEDGSYHIMGGASGVVPLFSGYTSLDNATLQLNRGAPTTGASKWATLDLITDQSETSDGPIGSLIFANTAIGASDKRIGTMIAVTDGAINTGALVWGLWNAGSYGEAMRLRAGGNLTITGKMVVGDADSVGAWAGGYVFIDPSTGELRIGPGGGSGGSDTTALYEPLVAYAGAGDDPDTIGIAGLTAMGTAAQMIRINSGATGFEYFSTLGPASGGTGLTTFTTGDIPYASASNTLAKRSIGSTGDVFTVAGGVPVWSSQATFFNSTSFTSTLTAISNVSSATFVNGRYYTIGSYVYFTIKVRIDPTAAGSAEIAFSIPLASALSTDDLFGSVSCNVASQSGNLSTDVANSRGTFIFSAAGTDEEEFVLTGSYLLSPP